MMKKIAFLAASSLLLSACAQQPVQMNTADQLSSVSNQDLADMQTVAPAMAHYTEDTIEKLWARPGMSARDRSLVTVAALIARHQADQLPHYINLALDSGVKPGEIAETITHLAFYSSWGDAMSATRAAAPIFKARGISTDQLPKINPEKLPLDEEAEARRAGFVSARYGDVAPGVVEDTTKMLFRDLWLRPGLEPRDRSMITVAALVASGQAEQVTFHLNKAMVNGLTQTEASEMLTQLAYYAGWPKVFSAMPVFKQVFEARNG